MLGQSRRITLLGTLGEGGFGAVYLAEVAGDDGFAQRAALKVLHKDMSRHRDLAGRQRDEARLLGQLNHEHIVRVLDLGEYDGRPAVLMEYVEGVDGHALLREGPVPPRATKEIVAAVASALDVACTTVHPRTGRPLSVVHRDIKPANILVTPTGGVKVLDFGVAKADFDREGKTESVQFGTARYMAPEVMLDGLATPAVDVYALGITCVELLQGEPVERVPLHARLFEEAIEQLIDRGLSPVPDLASKDELRALLRRMLAYEAHARPCAAAVHEAAVELADVLPGDRLRRHSRQVVPTLLRGRVLQPAPAPPSVHLEADEESVVPAARLPRPESPAETASMVISRDPSDATRWTPVPRFQSAGSAQVRVDVDDPPPSSATAPSSEVAPEEPLLEPTGLRPTWRMAVGVAVGALLVAMGAIAVLPPLTEPEPVPVPAEPASPPVEHVAGVSAPSNPSPDQPGPRPAQAGAAVEKVEKASVREASTAEAPSAARPATRSATTREAPEVAAPSHSCGSKDGVSMAFSSNPLGAEVELDGSRLGRTPLLDCSLPPGTYALRMRLDDQVAERTIQVGARTSTRYAWTAATNTWVMGR